MQPWTSAASGPDHVGDAQGVSPAAGHGRFSYRQVVLALLLPVLASVFALGVAAVSQPRVARLAGQLETLERWDKDLDELQDRMLAAESAVRGFRLTGASDIFLLAPFESARREVPGLLERLRQGGDRFTELHEPAVTLAELAMERLRSLERLRDAPGVGSEEERRTARLGLRFSQRLSQEVDRADRAHAVLVDDRQAELRGLAGVQRLAWLAVPIGLLLSIVMAVRMARRAGHGIQVLKRNIVNLVEGRELEPFPPDGGQLEGLAAALEETARMLDQREVQRLAAKHEAERANAAKTAFLSRMSHELRTPLTAVLGFAELLEMDELSDDQRDSVRHIRSAGRHLLTLINEVLDVSRIESGNLAVSIEPIEVGDVVGNALTLIRPLAEERGIRLPRPSGIGLFVRADRQRLSQVLLNLLSNAVKYNREFGEIALRVELDGEVVRIAVADTGMGIAPELLPRVFNPFDRLGAEQTAVEGTGVGLLLSKGLVEAMHGRLSLESTAGVGTTFTIELPAAEQPEQPEHAAPATPASTPAPAPPPAASPGDVQAVTVLYVEDNAANLDLIARFIGQLPGVELITTMQGRLAFDMARLHQPDVVLLDLHLPDLDGEAVLRRLRADPETAGIRVVMLTADATPGQERRLRALGADDYITKPLDFSRLTAILLPGDAAAPS